MICWKFLDIRMINFGGLTNDNPTYPSNGNHMELLAIDSLMFLGHISWLLGYKKEQY